MQQVREADLCVKCAMTLTKCVSDSVYPDIMLSIERSRRTNDNGAMFRPKLWDYEAVTRDKGVRQVP